MSESVRQLTRLIPDVEPDDIAVVATDRSFTWDELERRACRLANSLDAAGIGEGGVWAALLHNRIEWPEIVLGNSRAGSRYVPLNWHLTANELAELLTDRGRRCWWSTRRCARSPTRRPRSPA